MRKKKTEGNYTVRMMSHKEAAAYIGLGLTTSRRLLEEIGAVVHVGKRVLFDKKTIDEYLDKKGRA